MAKQSIMLDAIRTAATAELDVTEMASVYHDTSPIRYE
ncbi:Unannotated [Lentimonas sp. CC19]|nr:Unannotated [Lentimonas sp. CC19]CAA6694504.1 Unannotated [Lentimonas sp. CC10]CAA7070626.1 Unannotated [Lentimonas sp. CC11]